jgi:hypothetical protein
MQNEVHDDRGGHCHPSLVRHGRYAKVLLTIDYEHLINKRLKC